MYGSIYSGKRCFGQCVGGCGVVLLEMLILCLAEVICFSVLCCVSLDKLTLHTYLLECQKCAFPFVICELLYFVYTKSKILVFFANVVLAREEFVL